MLVVIGAPRGIRTRTPVSEVQHLKLACLPFHQGGETPDFHGAHGGIRTLTAFRPPPSRSGVSAIPPHGRLNDGARQGIRTLTPFGTGT